MKQNPTSFLLAIISFVCSIMLIVSVSSGTTTKIDENVLSWIDKNFSEALTPFFEIISELGSKIGIGIIGVAFVLWLWWKKRDYIGVAIFAVAIAIGNAVNNILKEMIGRERPISANAAELDSLSFPSGHAMVGLITYMLLAYYLQREAKSSSIKWMIGVVAGIVILLIGLSRNVLQVHFPSDILGGYFIGYLWAYFFILIDKSLRKRVNKNLK